ncbi:23S rRNA (uridine(2552)-2'-O-)-methyltransferase [Vavraia culicis subsp. floridensis]|uniref:23S rRNA (Uridine(2552)-2'-O-)-methyltransferase n=1 Tax=Vavraia culicis (isolate floridensis) TaxID=948595 RepID=L2GX25_VAVCU|nr:23S rRNA (uridine(2552)-2'-O-)-methyltransferase [Vavraia culicis subsp. floridensis]ELA48194.1 23S rRNA (uridine(2552)-2'-O-)-methyltransferase [Vavraia culicis subsp. floridensis]
MGTSSKDKRDIYYRLAKENDYRARSAYKIKQIDEHYKILHGNTTVVDLCAAPGGWTQVVAEKCAKVVAVDIQDILTMDDVIFIKEDITSNSCTELVLKSVHFLNNNENAKADLVLCDGASNISGMPDVDVHVQHSILCSALKLAGKISRAGSTFVGKLYRDGDVSTVLKRFLEVYEHVELAKPKCSRSLSIECFVVAMSKRLKPVKICENHVPVFECLSVGNGPDPDVNTDNATLLVRKHKFPPLSPPYKKAVEKRKMN